jgi:hypothetical protein
MQNFTSAHQKNLFDTFGFVKLNLPKSFNYDAFITDVNSKAAEHLSLTWEEILRRKLSFIVPAYADNSELASDFLVNYLDEKIQALVGKNYFYMGSDASVFFAAGSAWHRDLAMRLPVLKINIYLDFDTHNHSCDFLIIPGSHLVDTTYSGLLQKGLAWPEARGVQGGLCEKEFFPAGSDPTDPCYQHELDIIPNHCIKVASGSVVAFNTAAIHAVKSCVPIGRPRRLITFICCANPADLSASHFYRSPHTLNLNDNELIDEIYAFRAMELKRYGVSTYGPALLAYEDYIARHGLDWDKIKSMAEQEALPLQREDGRHESVQEKTMANFLTQNIPEINVELI